MPLSVSGTAPAGSKAEPVKAATATEPRSAARAPDDGEGFASAEHEAEYRAFVEKHPDLEAVEFLLVDPNGVMRGKWA
ncbi:MAG: hypothetical protein ABJK32_10940, partial [Nitratireductor sp.]